MLDGTQLQWNDGKASDMPPVPDCLRTRMHQKRRGGGGLEPKNL